MKNIILLLAFTIFSQLKAQTTAITNQFFEQMLVNQGIDSDGLVNGQILTSDALAVTELILNLNSGPVFYINNLTGLEAFVNLQTLSIDGANLSTSGINLSSLINLQHLSLINCYLQSVDLSSNVLLQTVNLRNYGLDTFGNSFTFLDLSNNPLINSINLYNNHIFYINLKNNTQSNLVLEKGMDWLFPLTNNISICIEVDNEQQANDGEGIYENWLIGGPSSNTSDLFNYSFSENCTLSNLDYNKVNFKVYPNPVIDVINLEFDETEIQIIEISFFSIDGKKIKTFEKNVVLNIEDFSPGIYLLNIQTTQGNFSQKIIKK